MMEIVWLVLTGLFFGLMGLSIILFLCELVGMFGNTQLKKSTIAGFLFLFLSIGCSKMAMNYDASIIESAEFKKTASEHPELIEKAKELTKDGRLTHSDCYDLNTFKRQLDKKNNLKEQQKQAEETIKWVHSLHAEKEGK